MKKLLILLSAAAAITFYGPAPSIAQGIGIGVPGVGIQIGEPNRPRYREYDRRRFREREVRYGQEAERSQSSAMMGRCAEFAAAIDAD